MGRGRGPALLLGFLVMAVPACTRTVAGTPAVAPPHAFPVTAPAESAAGAVSASGALVPPGPALEPDVLADECLLDAGELAALLGRPVRSPRESVVRRDDGSRSAGCYVAPATGAPVPLAAINVYRVRTGTPAEFVRAAAAGGRVLTGVGEAAAVLETAAGATVQAAGSRYLVTLVVEGSPPDDEAWRAAARAALARLPG